VPQTPWRAGSHAPSDLLDTDAERVESNGQRQPMAAGAMIGVGLAVLVIAAVVAWIPLPWAQPQ